MVTEREALSRVLPPLIFGTATFNIQYNKDPFALDTNGLVEQALSHGVRAFDTSPYYGPAEELLGAALSTSFVRTHFPREQYFILTKAGRISSDTFDYSAEWVKKSVARSLERLKTDYLDVVYCHDVEFVSPAEVLTAVRELRRIRDEDGTIKYIGISGYPLEVLCSLAEQVRDTTGEPLDIVMSYANFTLQNSTLATQGIKRLQSAGVDVVPNASPLGMGLLRADGVPEGSAGDWHPAPKELRTAVASAAEFTEHHGELLEVIAIRYALESWISAGSAVGSLGDPASGVPWERESNSQVGGQKLGVSVMGVSKASELQKTLMVWRSILDGLENGQNTASQAGRWKKAHEWSLNRRKAVQLLAEGVQDCLGDWVDFAWESPDAEYLKQREKRKQLEAPPWPTPEASPEPAETKVLPLR
jgi:D-arabinose 1-dehydrogenase